VKDEIRKKLSEEIYDKKFGDYLATPGRAPS
jgi:hypothetical protein